MPLRLGDGEGHPRSPRVALSGSAVYVAWLENDALWFRRSLDAGRTFEPAVVLSTEGSTSTPFLVALQDRVYVGPGLGPIDNLSGTPGTSFEYAAASNGSRAHVVWSDDSGGDFDIYYRRLDAAAP